MSLAGSSSKWAERYQVLTIIVGAGVVMAAVWFFLLLPLNQKRRRLERSNRNTRSELAAGNYLLGEGPLRLEKDRAAAHNAELHNAWDQLTRGLTLFPDYASYPEGSVERIDFKVQLFEVRRRLQEKSAGAAGRTADCIPWT